MRYSGEFKYQPVGFREHRLDLLQVGHIEVLPQHLLDRHLHFLEGDGLSPVVEHGGDLLGAPEDLLQELVAEGEREGPVVLDGQAVIGEVGGALLIVGLCFYLCLHHEAELCRSSDYYDGES